MTRRWSIVIVACLLGGAPPVASAAPPYRTDNLPAPFNSWGVEVKPDPMKPDDPQHQVILEFSSPALGLRAASVVLMPDDYLTSSKPWPVVYYLHGTRNDTGSILGSEGRELSEQTGAAALLGQIGQDNPLDDRSSIGQEGRKYRDHLDEQRFLMVIPDAGPEAWCGYCSWIDWPDGRVRAETHLVRELLPLVEAVFRARVDRGGRGIFGFSMGARGTFIQGFRHPDLFAFVGGLSGALDRFSEPLSTGEWIQKGRNQGYLPPRLDEIQARNINPIDLAPQMVGANVELMFLAGDGCFLGPNPEGCDPTDYQSALIETGTRIDNDESAARLAEAGIPLTYIKRTGIHGANNGEAYVHYFLPRMNRIFAGHVSDPMRFSYKTADKSFSVWGYDVTVNRPNEEFLNVLGARRDARDLILAGTGSATISTPPVFRPGRSYELVITPGGGTATARTLTADGGGRLRYDVALGSTRPYDERRALVDAGLFPFPDTRVEVLDAD
jgi:S-formylglutathione hydrolase FrmB